MFFTKTDDYEKMCDKNKNVTKMGMIIKGVYYIYCTRFEIIMALVTVVVVKALTGKKKTR